MTLQLRDLDACFEGVIPSIIATASAQGVPNVSYLSQVIRIDDEHIGLSNQFFGKTAANLRANPCATILLVDGRTGHQFQVDALYETSLQQGELFDRVAAQIAASSSEIGMAGAMRLRALDVFRVLSIIPTPSPTAVPEPTTATPSLAALAEVTGAIARANDAATIVDAVLDGLTQTLGHEAVAIFLHDRPREVLATVDSRGMGWPGAGSELPVGHGVAGVAAAERRLVKVSDLSRIRRFSEAIRGGFEEEDRGRTIPLPSLPGARSQIAVPLVAQDVLHGVLTLESTRTLAFGSEDEAALTLIAHQTAVALALAEAAEPETAPVQLPSSNDRAEQPFRVVHHPYDDSVFFDDAYIIKGVAGRLLVYLLECYLAEGRTAFSNREIRLAHELRLPDLKDNLETRLLLLRRRLEERGAPVRIIRTGRGRLQLELKGNIERIRREPGRGSA